MGHRYPIGKIVSFDDGHIASPNNFLHRGIGLENTIERRMSN